MFINIIQYNTVQYIFTRFGVRSAGDDPPRIQYLSKNGDAVSANVEEHN
jgi:hypothetical protein